jgi:transglutaminase-like putative cysteine protease
MTLAAGAAVALGAAPLGAVFDEWSWLWYAWAAVATVTGAHLLARYLRLPALLVPVVGAAGLLLYLTAVFCTDGALFGIIPTPDSLQLLRAGIDEGFQNINDFATPVPTTTGLVLLTAGALGLTTILVDFVAVTLRRPAASGLALLALYAVPVAVVLSGVPWVLFAIAACGYLMLLLVEGRDRLLHWGRPVGATPRPAASSTGAIQVPSDSDAPGPLTGQRIGAVAIALAVILPLLVPGMTGNALNRLGQTGSGDGTGSGNGPLNEFAALRGELRQGQEVALMSVSTDLPEPQYLRTKVLDRYQSNGWSASRTSAPTSVGDGTALPAPLPAEATGPSVAYSTNVQLTDQYSDDHLPVYYAPSRVDGVGNDWHYDDDKAVVVNDRRRGGFSYSVEGNEPTPSAEDLAVSPPLTADERRALPDRLTLLPSLPRLVVDTVDQVTRGLSSPYQQAKAINDYFTDGKNGFAYAENTLQGNSGSVLVDFLKNKQGFCEQYAAAMAVMLRVKGIPSRVVIGYTPGNKGTDNRWTVTNHDAHAWVEAYFSGVGWAYFDPTPLGDGRTVAPAYAPRPNAADGPSSGSSASADPSAGATPNQIPKEDLNPGSSGGGLQGAGLITPRRLLIAGIVLVVLLVLLLPAFVRLSIRRRRMRAAAGADAGAAARAAWDEVVGSAADYGVPVPASDTPRGLARRLDRDLELDTEASRGLRLVALAEERARYAARAGVDGDLPAAVRAVRQGLRGEAGRRRRWRAALLPPSTVRAARSGSATRAATASTALNRLGGSIRRPVTPRRR